SRSRWRYIADAIRIGKGLPRPEVVTSSDPAETGLAAWRLASAHGAKLHLQVHTDMASPYFKKGILNRVRTVIARFLLPRADGIRVVSERILRSLKNYKLKAEPVVLPIFTDSEKYVCRISEPLKKKYPQFDFMMLTVARLEPEKDIACALRTLARVVREYPRVGLVIVGEGSERAPLMRRAKALGVERHVIFEGWREDVASYYCGADLYLSVSRYEGYGLSLVEAALSGLPIVTTDVGIAGTELLGGEGALIAPVGDDTALAKAVLRFLPDPEFRKKFARAARASVLGSLPDSKRAYLAAYRAAWESALLQQKKKVLFITQKIDLDDPVLGFFHRWVEALAPGFSKISVVCLEKGRADLTGIPIYSLGKETKRSRLRYLFNFYRYLFRLRHEYDTVFVHMNEEYVILGALFWKLMGKRVTMWRNHYEGGLSTRLAVFLADTVFCTSRHSFTARFRKTKLMPVGVDTALFRPNAAPRADHSVLSLSRVAPSKNLDIILESLIALSRRSIPFTADFYGEAPPEETEYVRYLTEEVRKFELTERVAFRGAVKHTEAPAVYAAHEVFVNASKSGMYDKTIFEAMSAETLILVSNKDLALHIHHRFIFKEGDAEDLSEKLEALLTLPSSDKARFGKELREFAVAHHSLASLVARLTEAL
ncbi:glycosyltransferase family 4 protein, partial [Candidatus Parcubacteria bacterium]|nr:glycosyltransferase family 4 protein [Candidatus Parcubacteria bacterium]